MILDRDIKGDTPEEKELNIRANDKSMHSRGYMKESAGFTTGGSFISNRLRNHEYSYRKIITEIYMEAGKDYYLRMRQLEGDAIMGLSYMEIVPYSVYSGENGPEDIY